MLRRKIYDIIRDDDVNQIEGTIFDTCIISLIIINIILVILDTFNLPTEIITISYYIETGSVIIFTIEYLMRLWTAKFIYPDRKPLLAVLKYAFSFMAIVDLLAILPFYIPFILPVDLRILRILRLFRLLRVLKMNRYTKALESIAKVFKNRASQLISAFFVIFLLMIISSITMYYAENEVQPEVFSNAFSGLWWAVATFTTVGYGDIYPITVMGKVISALMATLGIALVAVPTGIISAGFIEQIDNKKSKPRIKEKALSASDEELNFEVFDLYNSLPPELQEQALHHLRYLAAEKEYAVKK